MNNMSKSRRDEAAARAHAERARRGAARNPPAVFDYAKCMKGLQRIFAELDGEPVDAEDETPETSSGIAD